MFASAAFSQELNICLRCELRILRNRRRSPAKLNVLQRFSTSARGLYSRKYDNDVRTRRSSERDSQVITSRGLQESGETQNDGNTAGDGLRLETHSEAQEEQSLHGQGRFRRQDPTIEGSNQHGDLPTEEQASHSETLRKEWSRNFERDQLRYPAWRYPDVASDRVELGVKRLGEAATIRVIPERRTEHKHRREKGQDATQAIKTNQTSRQNPALTFDQMVKALKEEDQGAAGAAEAMNNIENLRKAFLSSINQFEGATQAECHKLAASLERGFTMGQLSGYKKLVSNMNLPGPDRLDTLTVTDRYSVSRWYTGPSKWPKTALRRVDPKAVHREQDPYAVLSTGKDAAGFPVLNVKQKLINGILNLCWGIRPQEERAQEGSVSMKIGAEWLNLLLQQNETVFYRVAQAFKVKTEISGLFNVVRIVGSYEACIDAVQAVTNSILAAQVEIIDLLDQSPTRSLDSRHKTFLQDIIRHKQFWQQVEQQTSTKIKPVNIDTNGMYDKIEVYHMTTDPFGLAGVKRRIVHLQRCIRESDFFWSLAATYKGIPSMLVPIAGSPDMHVTDRNLNWYRWRQLSPSESTLEHDVKELEKIDMIPLTTIHRSSAMQTLLQPWISLKESEHMLLSDGSLHHHWNTSIRTSTSATLGQIIYTIPDESRASIEGYLESHAITQHEKFVKKVRSEFSKHRRSLVGGVPNLIRLLKLQIQNESTLSNSFKIHLLPRTIEDGSSLIVNHLPTLELTVEIDEHSKTTNLQEIRLVLHRQMADIALPQQSADVRFTAETFGLGNQDNPDPSILGFLDQSNLDVWNVGRFGTPESLRLRVPGHICSLAAACKAWDQKTRSRQKNAAIENGAPTQRSLDGSVEVEYMFDSLEVHSKLQTLYQGFPLAISTIEAGQIGGKREEIKLEVPGIADHWMVSDSAKQESNLEAVRHDFMAFYNTIMELIGRLPK